MEKKIERAAKKTNAPKNRQKYDPARDGVTMENCCLEVYKELKDVQVTVRATNRDVVRIKMFLQKLNGGKPI